MLASHARVLTVDDSQTTRLILRGFLYKLGFHYVREAPNGGKALSTLETQAFDLILADWEMEPVNGLELLRRSADQRAGARCRSS